MIGETPDFLSFCSCSVLWENPSRAASWGLRQRKPIKKSPFPFVCYKQVIANQEAVDIARRIKDPQKAAKQLIAEALKRDSKDDISCIVVRFRG